jgi:diacylglycerol kinase family enzyme
MPPFKRFIHIPKVLRGAHLGLKEVEIRRAPWVEITLDRTLPAHMDGEPFELKPGTHRVEVVPQGLEVISNMMQDAG